MAKIIFSGLVTDGYGSIGGVTFSKNAAGNFIRARVNPVKSRTSKTGLQRGHFTTALRSWQYLSPDDRSSWDLAAPIGSRGINFYTSCYLNAIKTGRSPLTSPVGPAIMPPITIINWDAHISASNMIITLLNPIPTNTLGYVSCSMPCSPGSVLNKKFMRFIVVFNTASGASIDIIARYLDQIGFTPQLARQIFISIELVDTTSFTSLVPVQSTAITY